MTTHSTRKGKVKKTLLRGVYYNVPSPVGTVKANIEVYLHVQIRVDPDDQDDRDGRSSEGGNDGSDIRGIDGLEQSVLDAIAERIGQLVESATPASASLEKVAQAELFEGLEGR